MTKKISAGLVPTWTVGDRLRKARELTGMDAAEFADAIGVHRDTVANYEKDKTTRMRRVVTNAWAANTGVSYDWLMGDDGGLPANPGVAPRTPVPNPRLQSPDTTADGSRVTDEYRTLAFA